MRHGEAEGLTWADFDLENGVVRLDKNKTDDPRSWAMRPGTTRALKHWHELRGKPSRLVFVDTKGAALVARVDEYRAALLAVGVTRPEIDEDRLYTSKATGFHALRALMVVKALARGESERWVSDRTGHRSSQMISRFQRRARTLAEAPMTELADLDVVRGCATGSSRAPASGSQDCGSDPYGHRLDGRRSSGRATEEDDEAARGSLKCRIR